VTTAVKVSLRWHTHDTSTLNISAAQSDCKQTFPCLHYRLHSRIFAHAQPQNIGDFRTDKWCQFEINFIMLT